MTTRHSESWLSFSCAASSELVLISLLKAFQRPQEDKAGSLFDKKPPISHELIAEIWKAESDQKKLIYLYKQRSLVLGKSASVKK